MGGTHPLHAAAFLINQDRGIPADTVAQVPRQAAQLFGRIDIAGEQDESHRVRRPEKPTFPIC